MFVPAHGIISIFLALCLQYRGQNRGQDQFYRGTAPFWPLSRMAHGRKTLFLKSHEFASLTVIQRQNHGCMKGWMLEYNFSFFFLLAQTVK